MQARTKQLQCYVIKHIGYDYEYTKSFYTVNFLYSNQKRKEKIKWVTLITLGYPNPSIFRVTSGNNYFAFTQSSEWTFKCS